MLNKRFASSSPHSIPPTPIVCNDSITLTDCDTSDITEKQEPAHKSHLSLSAHSSDSLCSSASSACPMDLGNDSPAQPSGIRFPTTLFGERERSFSPNWYNCRQWLEYSLQRDAAFCYCCRKFCISSSTGEHTFRITGFRNWNTALIKSKGFAKHEASADHMRAMAKWKEKEHRCETGQSVSTLVNDTQLGKNRYYLCSILDVIRFLVTNELSFRGDSTANGSSDSEFGLFLRLLLVRILNLPAFFRQSLKSPLIPPRIFKMKL